MFSSQYARLLLCGIVSFLQLQCGEKEKNPVDYVDPMIGMSNSRWMLFPGPTMPLGMVKLSPDNQDAGWMAGYEYTIKSVNGFSHLHEWTMAGLRMLPVNGDMKTESGRVTDPFRGANSGYHSRTENERAEVGYYTVDLYDYGIRAELTATERCGLQRYTFTGDSTSRVLIDLHFPAEYSYELRNARIDKISDTELSGFAECHAAWFNEYTLHFIIKFDKKIKDFSGWNAEGLIKGTEFVSGAGKLGAFAHFDTDEGEQVTVQTGISFVSIENARLNLEKELGPFQGDFETVVQHNKETWNSLLGKIRVEGGTETDKIKFYTNLYRVYSARTMMNDVNGEYRDAAEELARLPEHVGNIYGGDAFWNTFWNCNGLWSLITPEISSDMANTQIEMYKRTGWTSKGPAGIEYSSIMEGSHEISQIVSTYQKGISNFDPETAYQAVRQNITRDGIAHPAGGSAGNPKQSIYVQYGYMPCEEGVISKTLDYAYDDYCVSMLARALGKTEDYDVFYKRSQNYKNAFDPSINYVRQRHASGEWKEPFDLFSADGLIEGNSWQYSWYVPHDMPGLIEMIGADEANKRLEHGFAHSEKYNFAAHAFDETSGQSAEYYINQGNQPNMQGAFIFNYTGKPWLTQKYTRAILEKFYGHTPLMGWEGDEDQGQMGAWFVMSAMGFFEMNGGVAEEPMVDLTSPLFEKITINLDSRYYKGKTFTVEAVNNSKENVYIQSAELNGIPLTSPRIRFSDIVGGGTLRLKMGPQPNETLWKNL